MYRIIQHKSVIFSECVPNVGPMFGLKQCGIQSVGPLKVLYTSHPGIPVHSDTHLASPMRRLHSPESCFLPHSVSWYVVCRLYSVGALLRNNCMTTVIICFRGALE